MANFALAAFPLPLLSLCRISGTKDAQVHRRCPRHYHRKQPFAPAGLAALVSGVDMTRQRSGKQQNKLENGVENKVKSLKFQAPGVVWGSWVTLLAPRWPKMRLVTRLGLYLEVCWGASWRRDGPS